MVLNLLVIFTLVLIAVFVFATAFDERNARSRVLRQRLELLERAVRRNPTEELELLRDELLSEIPALNRFLSRHSFFRTLQRFLSQAGMKMRAGKFLLLSTCCGCVLAMIPSALHWPPLTLLLFALTGLTIPFGMVSVRRQKRFGAFEKQFPEALELLSRAVRAGHSLATGLELIGKELPDPAAQEFRTLHAEQQFGLPLRDALMNLAERVPMIDVKFFATTLMLQRETGGNLAEILDKLSYLIRERFKIRRQVQVYTAQGRMTMLLLMALPPAVIIVLSFIHPDLTKVLFTEAAGQKLLLAAAALQFIGFLLIRKIIRIQV